MTRIVVIEDHTDTADLMREILREAGHDVRVANNGEDGVVAVRDLVAEVVLCEVGLPDIDGYAVFRQLRSRSSVPILVLTARGAEVDRVVGLELGADDYVTKPFSPRELVARIRAVLRRAGGAPGREEVLTMGPVRVQVDRRKVQVDEHEVTLTATEFELLRYLMRNPRRVLSKSQILDRVWHYDFGGQSNVVELYISYLRKKVDAGRAPMIHTVRGAGYVLKPAVG